MQFPDEVSGLLGVLTLVALEAPNALATRQTLPVVGTNDVGDTLLRPKVHTLSNTKNYLKNHTKKYTKTFYNKKNKLRTTNCKENN